MILGSAGLNQAHNDIFGHFHEFRLLDFLKIVYNDSLQKCLTTSSGKTHEK